MPQLRNEEGVADVPMTHDQDKVFEVPQAHVLGIGHQRQRGSAQVETKQVAKYVTGVLASTVTAGLRSETQQVLQAGRERDAREVEEG